MLTFSTLDSSISSLEVQWESFVIDPMTMLHLLQEGTKLTVHALIDDLVLWTVYLDFRLERRQN